MVPHPRQGLRGVAERPPACYLGVVTESREPPVPPPRVVFADLGHERGPLLRMHDYCVGAGRANEGLRADWQRQLRQVRDECGFRYLRFHGLFCDDMGVYFEDARGGSVHSWHYVDQLFDFLLEIGMKPFVELGFMPTALASGPQTLFWYRANVTPPKDYAKWAGLVESFVRHVTERYGTEEVQSWYFEVWNEPNLKAFWDCSESLGTDGDLAARAKAEYLKLYACTARAIKTVDASYRVGGPATAGSAWVPETIAYCQQHDVPLDFVSTHSYATVQGYLDENGTDGTVLSPDPLAITREVERVREQMLAAGLSRAELHYTEWSTSYSPTDPIHDSYHSAAFILDKLRRLDRAATSMSYWTFTDIFEEQGPRTSALHGGFGLLNYHALPKPSYFVYRYLHRLGGRELRCADPQAYVCRDAAGSVQALFWDFSITHPGPSIINQEYYRDERAPLPKTDVELRLDNLASGRYRLLARRVGHRQNDLQSAWRDLGAPPQLTRSAIEELRRATADRPVVDEPILVAADGGFVRRFPMRENDVWFVELERQSGSG